MGPYPIFGHSQVLSCLHGGPSTFPVFLQDHKVGIQSGVRDRAKDAEPHQDLEILYLHVRNTESKFEPFYHIHVLLVPLPN